MIKIELKELIRNGADSKLEFKQDTVSAEALATVLVSFLNLDGGTVLLGVKDDGEISGVTRDRPDEWVAEICRAKINLGVLPITSWIRGAKDGHDILSIHVSPGPDKPYACVHNNRKTYYIRVVSTSREATQEELERMFQASGRVRYGAKPVPGTTLDSLDIRRLRNYLTDVLDVDAPPDTDRIEWATLLENLDLMTKSGAHTVATIDGLLLFGVRPGRGLPQSGIRAVCYVGKRPDYEIRADEKLAGPMVPLKISDNGQIQEGGLIEQAWDFVRRNTNQSVRLDGARRIGSWDYPEAAVREALVNAVVHRDYSIAGTDVLLAIYSDRLEIQSPGRLPNTITVKKMKIRVRYTRNQTLAYVMRDFGYVEALGMDVKNKIIPSMRRHNGTEPDLIAEQDQFTVVLWKSKDP